MLNYIGQNINQKMKEITIVGIHTKDKKKTKKII